MLGIVERILAALIILALLTLLIILAFPVPPRQPVGAPPSNEQRAEKSPDPVAPPTTTPAPGATNAPKQPPAKAAEPAPAVVKKSSERMPETVPPPAPVVVERKAPERDVLAKSNKERIVYSREEVNPPRPIVALRRDPVVVTKRERVRRGPVVADDCGRACEDDCCCDTRSRPYWAKPKRSVVVERGAPYWADPPPRRRRWAGIPPGACPE